MSKNRGVYPLTEKAVAGRPMRYRTGIIHNQICCDCGLTHSVVFEIAGKDMITETCFRNDWMTREKRRRK